MTTTGTAGGVRYGPAMELKAAADDWEVSGYVSTFGNVDHGGDVVLPGAYRKTLSDGHPIRFLYAHQPDQVLGKPLLLKEDDRGLFGRFKISKTTLGHDIHTLLVDKAIDAFSVGYIARDFEHDPRSGTRRLSEIELLEASLVSLPMNTAAVVTAAKAATKSLTVQYLEGYVAKLRARQRFARMRPAEVEQELAAMKLRLRLGLLGAGGR